MVQELPRSNIFSGRSGLLSRSRAFNLLEMLVVMLLIGIFAAVTYTSLDRMLPRIKLRGKATEMSGFLQKARLGAIKAGRDVSVEMETFGGGEQWLMAYRMNSDGSKTEMARLNVGSPDRPYEPHMAGAEGGSEDAAKAVFFGTTKNPDYDPDEDPPEDEDIDVVALRYKPIGITDRTGAFRISIGPTGHRNTIEVAVASFGGQPVLRKYIKPGIDRPSSLGTTEFFEETHYGTDWDWTWY